MTQRTAADHILRDLQNNPDMWLQVVHILSNTQNLNTKFFALQVSLCHDICKCSLLHLGGGIVVCHYIICIQLVDSPCQSALLSIWVGGWVKYSKLWV